MAPEATETWESILETAMELARTTRVDPTSFAVFARLAYRAGWTDALRSHCADGLVVAPDLPFHFEPGHVVER